MSICIISDHNYAKTKFHYNTQRIDQVKPKYEEEGFSPQSPPPPPPWIRPCTGTGESHHHHLAISIFEREKNYNQSLFRIPVDVLLTDSYKCSSVN